MPFTSTDQPGTQNSLPFYFHNTTAEFYQLNTAAGTAYEAMDATDARKTSLNVSSGRFTLSKWTDVVTNTNYAPVIRYAEVLLNRSEALVRAGGNVTQEAVDLLNAVRTRSFAAGAYTTGSFANAAAFYDAVFMERNMEFLGEGFRNMDLMRLGQTIPGKDGGPMGNVPAIAPTSNAYIWPIPTTELIFNKLMTPNE
jgi:hypothetical protein